jgi:hypothetical protein
MLANNSVTDLLTGATDFSLHIAQICAGTSPWNHTCLNIKASTWDSACSQMTTGIPGTTHVPDIAKNAIHHVGWGISFTHII